MTLEEKGSRHTAKIKMDDSKQDLFADIIKKSDSPAQSIYDAMSHSVRNLLGRNTNNSESSELKRRIAKKLKISTTYKDFKRLMNKFAKDMR